MARHLVDKTRPSDTSSRRDHLNRETSTAGLTADDIAGLWQIPKGTVYRYAHIYKWRRYTHAGRVYYHPNDVTATFDDLGHADR